VTDIAAFEAEMTAAKADWQLVQLGGAVHCFTEVGEDGANCRYDARAAARAYGMMEDFLGEAFAR
jgi:dienelactone hydrolase